MYKSVDKNLLLEYLQIVGSCYATGDFEMLYPYLSDDCVWESQWRLTPETGKESVINYFNKKGMLLRESGNFPKWMVVEFIDNMNPMMNVDIIKGNKAERATVGLMYQPGKLALFLSQQLDDLQNAIILDLSINDSGEIKRIDLCMPELFKFKKYEPEIKY